MIPCPGQDQLKRLLAEQLAEAEREAVEAHVEGCADCQLALERMAGGLAGPRVGRSQHLLGTDLLRRLEEARLEPPVGVGTADALLVTPTTSEGVAAAETAAGCPQVAGYEVLTELGHGGMGVVFK